MPRLTCEYVEKNIAKIMYNQLTADYNNNIAMHMFYTHIHKAL